MFTAYTVTAVVSTKLDSQHSSLRNDIFTIENKPVFTVKKRTTATSPRNEVNERPVISNTGNPGRSA